jgi:hypothetical protein
VKRVNVQTDTYISYLLVTNLGDSCTHFWGAVNAGGGGWGREVDKDERERKIIPVSIPYTQR